MGVDRAFCNRAGHAGGLYVCIPVRPSTVSALKISLSLPQKIAAVNN